MTSWTSADVSKATSRPKQPAKATPAPRPVYCLPKSPGSLVGPLKGQTAPQRFAIGPHTLAVAGGLHSEQLVERYRLVVTGPRETLETLLPALLAALA